MEELDSTVVVPLLYILLAVVECLLSVLYICRRTSRYNYSMSMSIILSMKLIHVYVAPSWGYNLLRRVRICVHIFGIIYAYLHLCNQSVNSQALRLAESWLLSAYVIMTTFLFRYHAVLRAAFESSFRGARSFLGAVEILLMVILVLCAVLVVVQLANRKLVSLGMLTSLLIINGVVDGRLRYWNIINHMDMSTAVWFLVSNIPPFVALLHTAREDTGNKKYAKE